MKRKLLVFFLTAALLITGLPAMTASAAGQSGRLEGIDYTRLIENSVLEKPVTFTIGGRSFTGRLANGKQLTDSEVDACVKGLMNEYSITSGKLLRLQQQISQSLQYDESRYVHPRVLAELVLASAGLGSAQQLSEVLTGSKPLPKDGDFYAGLIVDTALNKLTDFALGLAVGKTASTVIGILKSTADIGVREIGEYLESDEKAQQAVCAALALEEFYALCNARLREKEALEGSTAWTLQCAHTVWTSKTLFQAASVPQYWRLSCDLTRTGGSDDPTDWTGTYTGPMELQIWHDMSNFDEVFFSTVFMGTPLLSRLSSLYSFRDRYEKTSILYKTLRCPELTLVLGEGTAYDVSLEGFDDRSFFWLYHPIKGGIITPLHDGEGHFEYSGYGAHAVQNLALQYTFAGEFTADNRYVRLDLYQFDMKDDWTFTAPFHSEHDDYSYAENTDVHFATDYRVFSDLNSGKLQLRIK